MHGLVNRALQRFAEDTFGVELWAKAANDARPGLQSFEAMLSYDDEITAAVLDSLSGHVGLPPDMLLEDLGTYLVSHSNTEALRRLLRFGGETFSEFLYSLDDLPDRVRLAVPDLGLPRLDLTEHAPGRFTLTADPGLTGLGHVLVGLLRAMADDYGALAVVELLTDGDRGSRIAVSIAEAAYSEGREFDLVGDASA